MLCFVVEDVLKRAGVNQISVENKRRQVMRTHGFRKFFINQCDRSNTNFSVREHLVGHKLPNQDSHYIRKTEEEMLAEYVKAIPLLTIHSEGRLEHQIQEL
jgi:integrase